MFKESMMLAELIRIIFGAGMFINAALFIPQAVRIIKIKNTEDLSLVTFTGFCLIQASAIAYGYVQHDLYLMFGYGLSLLTCGFVTLLIVFYRKNNLNER
jgi:MtN3 and saliva related transmembrane protein